LKPISETNASKQAWLKLIQKHELLAFIINFEIVLLLFRRNGLHIFKLTYLIPFAPIEEFVI